MRSHDLFHLLRIIPLSALLLSPVVVHAAWQTDGVPLSTTAQDYQKTPAIAADGAGGAIVVWQDNVNGNYDIFAQRINASGAVQWAPGGVAVCAAAGSQYSPTIISDGAGGAIVTWSDARSGNKWVIFAQRIDASGAVQWTTNGVALSASGTDQYVPWIAADGAGGAIVTWQDLGNAAYDVVAQRINAFGTVKWAANGVPICTAAGNQYAPHIVSDGAGGAIMTWEDDRDGAANGNTYEGDVYAQRISHTGVVKWTANGTPLCTAAGDQQYPLIVSDAAGGAIVVWVDNRSGPATGDIYTQRISHTGVVQWTADGTPLCTAAGDQNYLAAAADGAGGVVAAWEDHRSGTNEDLYGQRIDASGVVQWAADGIALCTAASAQLLPRIVSDAAGGAVVTWQDLRSGADYDIYAQRIGPSGAAQWTTDGVALCTAAHNQQTPVIVADETGAPIVAWEDYRSGSITDNVYTQKLDGNGTVPTAVGGTRTPSVAEVALSANYPNPFSVETTVDLTLRHEAPVTVDVFDAAGRRVRKIDLGIVGAGDSWLTFDGRDASAHPLPTGVYFYQVHAGSETATRKMVLIR